MNFSRNFRLALRKANLKRKEVMNCLNMSKYEFESKANTGMWSSYDLRKLRNLGLDKDMPFYKTL